MPLVPATCTQCGATLTLDPAQRTAAVCPFCGTPFVVEQAVAYYTSQTSVGTVEHVEHLHVNDERSREARLQSAEDSLVKLHDWDRAFATFKSVADDHAGEWRAWWGMARAKTRDLQAVVCRPELDAVKDYARRAEAVADADAKTRLAAAWSAYLAKVDRARRADYRALGLADGEIARLDGMQTGAALDRLGQLEKQTGSLERRVASLRSRKTHTRNWRLFPALAVAGLVVAYALSEGIPLFLGETQFFLLLSGAAAAWAAGRIFLDGREADAAAGRLAELGRERDRLVGDLESKRRLVELRKKWDDVPLSNEDLRLTHWRPAG